MLRPALLCLPACREYLSVHVRPPPQTVRSPSTNSQLTVSVRHILTAQPPTNLHSSQLLPLYTPPLHSTLSSHSSKTRHLPKRPLYPQEQTVEQHLTPHQRNLEQSCLRTPPAPNAAPPASARTRSADRAALYVKLPPPPPSSLLSSASRP